MKETDSPKTAHPELYLQLAVALYAIGEMKASSTTLGRYRELDPNVKQTASVGMSLSREPFSVIVSHHDGNTYQFNFKRDKL